MIDSIASHMNEFPSIRLEIRGYTDYIGASGYNKWLSLQRAKALMQQIVSKNIYPSRISIQGKGSASPLARDKTARGRDIPAGRGWNRRVELIFSDFEGIDIQRIKPPVPIEIRINI
jgi:OOP family OmpA-OmpF porin